MSGVSGLSSGEVVLGGVSGQGWWLVVDEEGGPGQIVAGPFPDRADAGWVLAAQGHAAPDLARPVYGIRRRDGGLDRRPSPQDWAWLAYLGEQLDRLPEDGSAGLTEDDPLTTLVVEVAAALSETGLPLHDAAVGVGGACLTAEPALGAILVSWRQHDRMSVDQVHGPLADETVQQVMNRALADVLVLRGFSVEGIPGASGHLVRSVA